jgi:hypothetical protein
MPALLLPFSTFKNEKKKKEKKRKEKKHNEE